MGYLKSTLWRIFLCPMGIHGPRFGPDRSPANYCAHGCGHAFNTSALSEWSVTTKTGEIHQVRAVNEHHARSIVIYGGDKRPLQMDAQGRPLGPQLVHPANILSVVKV